MEQGATVEGVFVGAGLFVLMMLGALLGVVVLWFWAFVTIIRRKNDWDYRAGTQLAWLLTLFFLGPVGPVLYLLFGHSR